MGSNHATCTECQRTFAALARSYERTDAVVFVRELFMFADEHAQKDTRCVDALAALCRVYRDNIGEDAATRIASFDETYEDTRRARQAAFHLRDDTVDALTKRMTWSSYFKYRFVM